MMLIHFGSGHGCCVEFRYTFRSRVTVSRWSPPSWLCVTDTSVSLLRAGVHDGTRSASSQCSREWTHFYSWKWTRQMRMSC